MRTAATTSAPPRWRSTRTAISWRCACRTLANMGAYLSTFAPCVPTYLYAHAARRRLQDAGDLLRGEGGVHQHRAGRCLSRRRPAGGDVPARASGRCRARTTPGSIASRSRRKNFIPADAFPYQTPVALQYDSGNYQATLDACLKAADYAGFEARRAAAGREGQAARHRRLHLPRGLRHRAIGGGGIARRARRPVRGGEHPGASDRQRHRVHRHAQPRPGARNDARAAGRAISSACRWTRSISCTAIPRKSRSAWAPTAAAASPSAAARW